MHPASPDVRKIILGEAWNELFSVKNFLETTGEEVTLPNITEAGYYVKPGEQPTMMWKNFMSAENNYQRGGLFGYYLPEQVEKM